MKKKLNLMKVTKELHVKDMKIKIHLLMKKEWKKNIKKCLQLNIILRR